MLVCYSKAVVGEPFCSDEWTQIQTRFEVFDNKFEKALKVNEYGVGLIYSHDLQQIHPLAKHREHTDDRRICNACQQDGMMLRRKFCFKGNDFSELPIIKNPLEIDRLCLPDGKNLASLPNRICDFKSMSTLSCSGCSKLESFPEILQDMESLRKLYLNRTAIKELPSSIQRLRGFQYLFLKNCKNPVNLPESIYNLISLTTLIVKCCPTSANYQTTWENYNL